MIARLTRWLIDHQKMLLKILIPLTLVAGILRLGVELNRALIATGEKGAIDLKHFFHFYHSWVAGNNYAIIKSAYPPASHLLFWPLVGWLNLPAARWWFTFTNILALVSLIYLAIKYSQLATRLEKIYLALLIIAMYPTGVVIGNCQIPLHVINLLIVTVLMLSIPTVSWSKDLLVSLFMVCALIKPNISAPFGALVLFIPSTYRHYRHIFIIGALYLLLTAWALSFQTADLATIFHTWATESARQTSLSDIGYANLSNWLIPLGLSRFNLLAFVSLLLLHAGWIYHYRRCDSWLLLGVTALVARLIVYHGIYDDTLIIIPLITLIRMNRANNTKVDNYAYLLVALAWFPLMAPARLHMMNSWLGALFWLGQPLFWLVMLSFLMMRTQQAQQTLLKNASV